MTFHKSRYVCAHSVMSDSFTSQQTAACQVPLSMEFSRKEYWNRLPFPFPGNLPNPGIEPMSLHWQVGSLHQHHLGSSIQQAINCINGSEMASLLPNLAFSLPPLVCHLSSGCQFLQEIYVYVCSQGTSSKNVVTMNMHKLPNFFMQNVA